MTAILSKWGNSLAIRIPANIIEKIALHPGDQFSIELTDTGAIVLERQSKTIDFAALYAQITPDTVYEEITVGQTLGGEASIW